MNYVKTFENLSKGYGDIKRICEKYRIKNYTIKSDLTVDVDGNVSFYASDISNIPLQFGIVTGYFNCAHNRLKTLDGSPNTVYGDFLCGHNKLRTLEGSPRHVGHNFYCENNKLQTMLGGPERVDNNFYCGLNDVYTMGGFPKNFNGNHIDFRHNPIDNIYRLFRNNKDFILSLEWDYLRNGGLDYGVISRSKFVEACGEVGIKAPDYIPRYRYI